MAEGRGIDGYGSVWGNDVKVGRLKRRDSGGGYYESMEGSIGMRKGS